MPKLVFRYGTCASGKTAALLGVHDMYKKQNKRAVILKPKLDTRLADEKEIRSRNTLSAQADYVISSMDDIHALTRQIELEQKTLPKRDPARIRCVLAEECQFFPEEAIAEFRYWTFLGVPVLCYGLRTDYRMQLFGAARALMAQADVIEEVKGICACQDCDAKSCINLKLCNGKPVDPYAPLAATESVIDVGFEDKYMQVCYKHFFLFFPKHAPQPSSLSALVDGEDEEEDALTF